MTIQFTYNEFINEDFSFHEKFGHAMKDGIFYLGIPEELNKSIAYTMEFSQSLKTKSHEVGQAAIKYKTFEETQISTLTTSEDQWKQILPNEVLRLASAMSQIAITILEKSLCHLSIPKDDWPTLTGKSKNGEYSKYFVINYYDPFKKKIGVTPHKDSCWISLLFFNKAGFERRSYGTAWEEVRPLEKHFVVNYGLCFEVLVNCASKLNACYHRVRQIEEERISLVSYFRSSDDAEIYQREIDGAFKKISFDDFKSICIDDRTKLENSG